MGVRLIGRHHLGMKTLRATTLVIVCCAVFGAWASTSEAKSCGGSVSRTAGITTLTATNIAVSGGMTCAYGRVIVGRFFDRQLRDFNGCAIPAANGRHCRVGLYRCDKRGTHRLIGGCRAASGKAVGFDETDSSSG